MSTDTVSYTFQPPPPPASPSARAALITGLTILVLFVAAGAWYLSTRIFGREDLNVTADASAAGTSSVRIDGSDADVTVEPSTDGSVHVHATGGYSGSQPDISVRTREGETIVNLRCPDEWFNWCDINATVSMPADLDLTLTTDNGDVAIDGVTASIDLTSNNGTLEVTGGTGDLSANTDNGAITVRDSRATDVRVTTNNGSIDVELLVAPTVLQAQTDNGGVDLAVPGNAKYVVDTNTDNGGVDVEVGIDSDSTHRITATTDNGDIRVHPSS